MEEKPVISIIMPVFNSSSTLIRALDSAENQSITLPFEIILVLDTGQDDSLKIATAYASTHPNIRLYAPVERMGQGLSRLKGLELAKGDFLYFMDADDRLEKECLKTLYETISKTEADCVNCGFYVVDGLRGTTRRFPFHKNKTMDTAEALSAFFGDWWFRGFLWTKMFRRSAANAKPLLVLASPKDMFEDVALACSLLAHCRKVVSIADPLYCYYKNVPNSAMTIHRSDRALQHLKVIALERYFLEQTQNPSFLKSFQKHLARTYWSLLFDLHLDKKYGAKKDYIRLVKGEWKNVREMKKPLPVEGRVYEDLLQRAFYR